MTNLLLRLFIQKGADPGNPQTRERYGSLSGGVGIFLNMILFLGKLVSGLVTGSIAITADALNNLSDAATSIITLLGFRFAGQKADEAHPFGHGRAEYLTGLLVALGILLMGAEVLKSSVQKLFQPEQVAFSWLAVVILALAIAVKLWMYFFNRTLGHAIQSPAMLATAADSLSDGLSTAVVLGATLAGHWLNVYIDPFAGLIVGAFILKTGLETAKDTLDPLLGRPMDPALALEIDTLVHGHTQIMGIHDLVYHDYGPGRAMMSFHAEVPADGNLLELHDVVDQIEREIRQTYHIDTVIHMDPVVCDERTTALRQQVAQLAADIDPAIAIHDFRITAGPKHTNLIFEVTTPYDFHLSDQALEQALIKAIKGLSQNYYAVIQVERSFVDTSHNAT